MRNRLACSAAFVLFASQAALAAPVPEIVWIAPMNQTMPLAQFKDDKLTGGILRDMGNAISRRMGHVARFVSIPGDQVSAVLHKGKADGLCYVRPGWIDGEFNWTPPFMNDGEVIAALPGAPVLTSLGALRDTPVGTVKSHRHPRVELVLGERFHRVEANSMSENLHRVLNKEVQYVVTSQSALEYLASSKVGTLRTDIIITSYGAQCAFSKASKIPFLKVEQALNDMFRDGSVDRILARYR
jgi:polar amino acid transport system substrate-binding protein